METPAWHPSEHVTRAHLKMFRELADQIRLSEASRRQVLDLDEIAWRAWSDSLNGGALPPDPPPAEMLRRLSETAFHLALIAERGDTGRVSA